MKSTTWTFPCNDMHANSKPPARLLLSSDGKPNAKRIWLKRVPYRPTVVTYDDQALIDRLKSAYANDQQLYDEYQEVASNPRVHSHRRTVFGGFLWRTESGRLQLCVPQDNDLRETIMREFHESNHAGHQSYKRTLEKIRRRFWWNGMFKDVKDFCDGCPTC